ncbi:MAG: response regulator transcription factor [Pelomonas sp.]|nr:response regulator transcription factor [Roseateles sp.]
MLDALHAAAALHVAVLDDEPDVTRLVARYLGNHGFRASEVHSGPALMALMAADPAALVLLDLGLPGDDGFAVARQLRQHWHCGLVIVSGRGDSVDKVVGLEIGADDYVTKPFDLRELVARIKAVLRRLQPQPAAPAALTVLGAPAAPVPAAPAGAVRDCLAFDGWRLDPGARVLNDAQGAEVSLTHGEFELLLALAQHPGRVLSRDFLLMRMRGREGGPLERTIDVLVGRLRRKLEADPERPQLIKAVRSAGYVFVPSVESVARAPR